MFPIQLANDDLLGLLKRFPKLIHLSLGLHAGDRLEPTLDVTVLSPLIGCCPKMKYLGLHMRVPTDHPLLRPDALATSKPAKSLATICVGTSPFTDNLLPVAVYLSRILPESCRLVGLEELEPLQDMLTTLIQVQKQERTRASKSRSFGRSSLA
ncbi:hypothetical protein BDN71DRAFT_1032266 [Pleurotus eryngii]|uniref:Uncharacterized protein n=1 Tax=Pleurotus eryngii TaxID=5323 RepID=A0A9P6A7M9_PLEER|nr:hypothetical protein BDN71DRAFT_1032266 [Pleurotus eryngii]